MLIVTTLDPSVDLVLWKEAEHFYLGPRLYTGQKPAQLDPSVEATITLHGVLVPLAKKEKLLISHRMFKKLTEHVRFTANIDEHAEALIVAASDRSEPKEPR